jgi:hypothetical protein
MDQSNARQFDNGRKAEPLEFRNSRKIGLDVTLALVASAVALVIIAVSFFLMLLSDKHSPMMPGIIGGMCVIPIMGISFAVSLLKKPVRVLLYDDGLAIEWLMSSRKVSWHEVNEIELRLAGFAENWFGSLTGKKNAGARRLVLLDANARTIAQIGSDMENFQSLARQINTRSSAARQTSTFDVAGQTSRKLKSKRRQRVLLFFIGLFLSSIGIGVAIMSLHDYRSAQLLRDKGVTVEASINRHYKYNITPRIEYSFTAPDGQTYKKDVMVERGYWETLEQAQTVPVKYLPDNPENNKLVTGQIESISVPPALAVVLSLLVTGMGILCLAMYFLRISDIKFKDGKFEIVRTDDAELPSVEAILAGHDETLPDDVPLMKDDSEDSQPAHPVIVEESQPGSTGHATPAGLKAVAVLNIIFGGAGVVWNAGRFILAILFTSGVVPLPDNYQVPEGISWVYFSHALAMLVSLLLAISGVGILSLRNWGRIVALFAAYGKLFLGALEIVLIAISTPELADNEQKFVFGVTRAFYIFWLVLAMVYPAVLVYLLQRSSTRRIFRAS